MTEKQYEAFCEFRNSFKKKCAEWNKLSAELFPLQKAVYEKDTPEYPLENAVVYNTSLDSITQSDDIHLIVVGDNPGKEEQFEKNRKYLVGQSGRIAEGFFRRNEELNTDFRKNVIILNKTPLHTAKTKHLNYLMAKGGAEIKNLVLESQLWMAEATAVLHKKLVDAAAENSFVPELWLVGYAELKGKGIFIPYRNKLLEEYSSCPEWEKVFVYQHFSMNRFLIDLKTYREQKNSLSLKLSLEELGHKHRDEIFIQ